MANTVSNYIGINLFLIGMFLGSNTSAHLHEKRIMENNEHIKDSRMDIWGLLCV
ncbi:MAG TPA: hypothetical protein VEX17_00690 [Bacillales bacterium]|nr:hypothetical protein [Bacillales bacterium]